MIIAYGSLCIFLDEKERKTFLDKYKDKPCVLVEERDHSGKATSIIADNYHGMYAVAEHLVRIMDIEDLLILQDLMEIQMPMNGVRRSLM